MGRAARASKIKKPWQCANTARAKRPEAWNPIMKNTNRVRRNRGMKHSPSQVQNSQQNGNFSGEDAGIFLTIIRDGVSSDQIELTFEQYALLCHQAVNCQSTPAEILHKTMMKLIEINRTCKTQMTLINHTGIKTQSGKLPADLTAINSMLDPELREDAANWTASQRFAAAEKMRLWRDQLLSSAIELEAVERVANPNHPVQN
jgi:hypothetical protein